VASKAPVAVDAVTRDPDVVGRGAPGQIDLRRRDGGGGKSGRGRGGDDIDHGTTTVFITIAALKPLKEIAFTIGRESSTDSRLPCVAAGSLAARVTEATLLGLGLTYT